MAGFADLVRTMVGVADTLSADVQVTVTHKVITARDATNKPTSFSTTSRQCVYEERTFRPRTVDGVEVTPGGKLTFPRNVVVTVEDQFTLPSGKVARVLDVVGPADPVSGRYITEVYIGDSSRG